MSAIAAGWAFQQARQRARALDAAARDYVAWLRTGDRQAGVQLGAEQRFARALGVRPGAATRALAPDDDGNRIRHTLAARLASCPVAKQVDASALRLDDAAWRCNRTSDCTRRDARRLKRALRELDGALARERARLHLAGARLPLEGTAPPRLARPVPIRGSALIADWLGTNAWGHVLRSRPPHVLDFPDGHHLALQTRRGSVWATTWTDSTAPRGPLRIAEVPPLECGAVELTASDAAPGQCHDVAITAMVATRGGRVAVKLLRTDVSFVSELLLASADYGRSWEPGRPRSIR